LSFKAFSSRRSSSTNWKLCRFWSWPFICTHGLEIATLEIPTLKRGSTVVIDTEASEREQKFYSQKNW